MVKVAVAVIAVVMLEAIEEVIVKVASTQITSERVSVREVVSATSLLISALGSRPLAPRASAQRHAPSA